MPVELNHPELPLPPQVELDGLWHRYSGPASSGDWTLRDIHFQLRPGELVGLLGPSGCGKTTLLRLIAGFEKPDRGVVRIGGQEVAGPHRWLPPERRGVGMVFQDYALFPHLDAWRNACFGLRRGQDSSRAAWLLELLGLKGLERRYPHELSGGQRQRLALARALAPGCSLVLLDEPFSNLDVEVRLRLRAELPGVLASCGASGVIVTHDPEEALAICGRVAVLEAGRLHQCASPQELVSAPATAFVGRFVLQSNLLPLQWQGGRLTTALGAVQPLAGAQLPAMDPAADLQLLVGPRGIELTPDEAAEDRVLAREFLGNEWLYQVQCGEHRLRLRLPLAQEYGCGQRCRLRLRAGESMRLFPGGVELVALSS
ncbi:ABC transporter ATP-binding protein [Cyanobium sp. HWJ4-Hawea]|uniref:ABC transporter ATP-binding protein n=1 Tax=unclassified Cyanobium TaxID=2627006 RepID=UPI0020CDC286|nr:MULTISPECIES: ABC transporter ATP-binding protein [unclassified Cyanobium]MCP9774835.1 ABC transporter ATP-binding protein [Cyanobium sp. WAJ14-Wanaka]MCP9809427.1 ABC transporter ATP-binding protein [Cyanobium sp. HWJ4-Hawea]